MYKLIIKRLEIKNQSKRYKEPKNGTKIEKISQKDAQKGFVTPPHTETAQCPHCELRSHNQKQEKRKENETRHRYVQTKK